jgi:hypothetical protein
MSFIGMILQVMMICSIGEALMWFPYDAQYTSYQIRGNLLWLLVSWIVWGSNLFANILFITVRSCMR